MIDTGEAYVKLRKLLLVIVVSSPLPTLDGNAYSASNLLMETFRRRIVPPDGLVQDRPAVDFQLGYGAIKNKIRIYYQPYERSDELMEIGVWVMDSEMHLVWDTFRAIQPQGSWRF